METKLGLIDLDDTLVSWPKNFFSQIAQGVLKNSLGRDVSLETARTIMHLDYAYLKSENIPVEKFWNYFNVVGYAARLEAMKKGEAKLMPGAHKLLCALKEEDYTLGIISNTPVAPGRLVLGYLGLAGYFDAQSFTLNDGVEKPNPEMACRITRQFKDLESTFILGDSAQDIEIGRAIGATTIHLDGKKQGCGADYCMIDLDEVIEMLQNEKLLAF